MSAAQRVREILDQAHDRAEDDNALAVDEEAEILNLVEKLQRDHDAMLSTLTSAQASGTRLHNELVDAKNAFRRLAIAAHKQVDFLRPNDSDLIEDELVDALEAAKNILGAVDHGSVSR